MTAATSGTTRQDYYDRLSQLPRACKALPQLKQPPISSELITRIRFSIFQGCYLNAEHRTYEEISDAKAHMMELFKFSSPPVRREITSVVEKALVNLDNEQAAKVVYKTLKNGPKFTRDDMDVVAFWNAVSDKLIREEGEIFPCTAESIKKWYENEVNQKRLANIHRLECGKCFTNEYRLSKVPAEIKYLTNLTSLTLSQNDLTELPPEIEGLKNLKTLLLGFNKFTKIPAQIDHLTNLQYLDLTNNAIAESEANFESLPDLQILLLSRNKLSHLPQGAFKLSALTKLEAFDNQITEIPTEIEALTNLVELHLSENNITSIPAQVAHLKNLTHLGLSRNRIEEIPAEFAHHKEIRAIYLDKNNVKEVPLFLKDLMDDGCWIHLNKNLIESVPRELKPYEDYLITKVRGGGLKQSNRERPEFV